MVRQDFINQVSMPIEIRVPIFNHESAMEVEEEDSEVMMLRDNIFALMQDLIKRKMQLAKWF